MEEQHSLNLKFLSLLTKDQDCRERNEPFSQMKNYVNYKTDVSLAPNRPFNSPTFYLHLGNRVINATHTQEFTPSFPQFFQFSNLTMKLNKKAAEVNGIGENDVEYKIHKFDVRPYRLGVACTTERIDWDGYRIGVNGNGKIFDFSVRRNVKVLLDGEPINVYLKIKKMKVSKRKSHPEVLVLFDNSFMASGHIELGAELVCKLHEIPGSYCTVDFQCDTQFRAMLRRCEPARRPPREDVIPIPLYQNLLRHLAAKLENTEDRRIEANMMHHKKNALLLAICPYFSSFFRVFHCYSQCETHNYLPEKNTWSAREKLVYLSWRLENEVACKQIYQKWEDNDFKTKCEQDRQCLYVRRLIRLGAFLSERPYDTKMPEKVLAEFLFQIHTALSALWTILNDKGAPKSRMLGETFKMLVSFQHVYQSSPENILLTFPHLPNNDARRIFLDVVLAKANEHVFNEAIHVYRDYPEIVLKSLMKHPNLVLFGVDKIRLPPRLLEGFASWMETRNGSSRRRRYLLLAEPTPSKKRRSEDVGEPPVVMQQNSLELEPATSSGAEPEVIELSEDEEPAPRRHRDVEMLREHPLVEISDDDDDDEPEVSFESREAREQQSTPRRVIIDNRVCEVLVQRAHGAQEPDDNVEEMLVAPVEQVEQVEQAEQEPESGEELYPHPEPMDAQDAQFDAPTAEHQEDVLFEHPPPEDLGAPHDDIVLFEHPDDSPAAPDDSPGAPEDAPEDAPEQHDAQFTENKEIVLFEHPDDSPDAPEAIDEPDDAPNQDDTQLDAPIVEQNVFELFEHSDDSRDAPRTTEEPDDAPEQEDAQFVAHPMENDDNAPSDELAEQQDAQFDAHPMEIDDDAMNNVLAEQPDTPLDAPTTVQNESELAEQQDAQFDVLPTEHDDNAPSDELAEPNNPLTAPVEPEEPTDAHSSEQDRNEPVEQHDAPTSEREGNEPDSPSPANTQDAPTSEHDESELMEQPVSPDSPALDGSTEDAPTGEQDAPGPSSAPGAMRNLFGRPLRTPEPEASDDAPEDAPEVKPPMSVSRNRWRVVLDMCESPTRSPSPEPERHQARPTPEVVTPRREQRGKIQSMNLLSYVFSKHQ